MQQNANNGVHMFSNSSVGHSGVDLDQQGILLVVVVPDIESVVVLSDIDSAVVLPDIESVVVPPGIELVVVLRDILLIVALQDIELPAEVLHGL